LRKLQVATNNLRLPPSRFQYRLGVDREVSAPLRMDPDTSGICVIAMTAHALKTAVDSATAAGCDASSISRSIC
jgi:hypothetical protein